MRTERFLLSFFFVPFVAFVAFVVKHLIAANGSSKPFVVKYPVAANGYS